MDVEDFCFPETTDSLAFLIDSPPLWQASFQPGSFSCHHEDKAAKKQEDEEEDGLGHSIDQEPVIAELGPGKGGESLSLSEERMDMLWEDFNEELLSPLVLQMKKGNNSDKEIVGFWCIKAWSISKADTDKPAGVVVLLKVLRKLFLIHGDCRSHKKGSHIAGDCSS